MAKMMFRASALREMVLRRSSIQRFIDSRCMLEDTREIWTFFWENPHIGLAVATNYEKSNGMKRKRFLEILSKPTLNIIFTGKKGGGKTVLSYWSAEELHNIYGKNTCILYPINYRPELLPYYFYPADIDDEICQGDFCIFDEAQLIISARRSTSNVNLGFSDFLTLQRQKDVSMIMVQQDINMSDLNEFRMADGFIFKPSGLVQLQEKMNKGDTLMKFLNFLKPLSNKETLFISSDLSEILLFENPMPTFWSEELSKPSKDITMEKLRSRRKELSVKMKLAKNKK